MKEFYKKINNIKSYLMIANILLVFFLILLSDVGILPLQKNDFIFFTFLVLAFALYRPGWAFLFFIGTLALENINLAPKELGLMLRPYQFIGALTALAVIVRFLLKRINFELPKFKWFDALPAILNAGAFLSALAADDKAASFKLSIILFSFLVLYFLARIFIQSLDDLKKILPFFLSSSAIVIVYGVWQNLQFISGYYPFETMPGRPNATFAEPDWLGIFLVFLLAVGYALIKYFEKEKNYLPYLYTFLTAVFTLLLLTVSRSSWLGAFLVTFLFLLIILTNLKFSPKNWQWGNFSVYLIRIVLSATFSVFLIYIFHMTNFQLFNRAQSTGGLQKITVACEKEIALLNSIKNVSELAQYNCRHINLEDIKQEQASGQIVYEIYRDDPNVNVRKEIYQKSWEQIKNNWLLGIGWGNIGKILGTDEQGAALNSSNIFLEVWLGSGIIGLLALVAIWIMILISALKQFVGNNGQEKIFGIFLLLAVFGLIIPNLFNAGILLGILWIFWAITQLKTR